MPSQYHRFVHNVKYFLKRKYKWPVSEASRWIYTNKAYLHEQFKNKITAHQVAREVGEFTE